MEVFIFETNFMVSGQLSGKTVFLVGNCTGGNFPQGQLPSGVIFLWGNYPGDNHSGGNCSGAIFPGSNLMKMIIYKFKNPVNYLRYNLKILNYFRKNLHLR